MKRIKCLDCDSPIQIPDDIPKGEIISCPCCALEPEYYNGELRIINRIRGLGRIEE